MQRIIKQLLSVIEQENSTILVVLISTVVLSGTLYSFYLGNNLRYKDEQDYYNIASNIITVYQYSLDGDHPTAYRPPGYPLILALLMLTGAGIVYLRILNFIALGLCIYLTHKILKKQSSPFAANVGALLVVCYPVLFYTAGTLFPQTIGSALFLLIILLLTRNTKTYRIFLLSGLLFGYLILTIPIFIFTLFVFAMWFYFSKSPITAKGISITIATSILLISVWSARNYAVFNTFVLVSSNSGINLLLGNSENTTPNAGVNVDISKYVTNATQLNLHGVERDAYYRSKAIEFVLSHKVQAVKLYCQKFLNYFNYRNELATKGEASSVKNCLMLVTYGSLLLLLVSRIFLMKVFEPSTFEVLLIILYVSSGLFYAIFFTRIRFRIPFDFVLISIVAMFVYNFCHLCLDKPNTREGTSPGTA